MFGWIAGAVGTVWRGVSVFVRIKTAIKEVQDVVRLSQQLYDKYDELDDDAKRIARELREAATAIKDVFKF